MRHAIVEDGCRRVLSSNDNPHGDRIAALVPDLEPVTRDVHEYVPVAQIARKPPPAFERQADLIDAPLDRDVQCGYDGRAEVAIFLQSVTPLKSLDGAGDRVVIRHRAGSGDLPGEVARRGEPLRQLTNLIARLASLDAERAREGGPAAFFGRLPVFRQRVAKLRVLRRLRGQVRERFGDTVVSDGALEMVERFEWLRVDAPGPVRVNEIGDAVREVGRVFQVKVGEEDLERTGFVRIETLLPKEALRGFLAARFERAQAVQSRGRDPRGPRLSTRGSSASMWPVGCFSSIQANLCARRS